MDKKFRLAPDQRLAVSMGVSRCCAACGMRRHQLVDRDGSAFPSRLAARARGTAHTLASPARQNR
jgi:hypothetical protein